MMRRSLRFLASLALVLAAGTAMTGGVARAQARPSAMAGLNATLLIVQPFPTFWGTRTLAFGSLVPGVPETVLPSSAQAGVATGTGVDAYRSITLNIAVPAFLTGPGGARLAVDFNGPYAASCELTAANACNAASFETWNPVATPTHTDTPRNRGPGNRYLYPGFAVYMGGRAVPTASQRAGLYTGTITITAVAN
jgi:hypothetical protein